MSIKQQKRRTNQPETGAIASPNYSSVGGCVGGVVEAGLVEYQPIELSNRRKSKFDDVGGDGDVG